MSSHDVKGLADIQAARRFMSRATAGRFVLCGEVERRMAERLELVRLDPAVMLDAGAGSGKGLELLGSRYPRARRLAIDSSLEALLGAGPRESISGMLGRFLGRSSTGLVCADYSALPVAGGACQLVWSNLALAWALDPMAALGEFHRVLDVDGLLMFSTYGPDTLKELRECFAAVDSFPHTLQFADMHDLGDMLVAAGMSEPVMDMEVITMTYADFDRFVDDLRATGQANSAQGRRRALLGRRAWLEVRSRYEALRQNAVLPATFEIIYGHAWKTRPRQSRDGRAIVQTELLNRPRESR